MAEPRIVQKMARVNVDPDAWTALRVEGLRRNLTLADYLGRLVAKEAARITRRDNDRDGDGAASSLAASQPSAERSVTGGPGGRERSVAGEHDRERSTGWVPPWEQ